HFTFFALDALEKLQDKIDFKALSPQQTLELARRIALEHAPHENLVRNLTETFMPYRDALKKGDRPAALKTLMDITLAENSGCYAFRLGARFLEQYLLGAISFGGKRVTLEGPWWVAKRQEMWKRRAQADREGILYGLPQVKNPAANANDALPAKRHWWSLT